MTSPRGASTRLVAVPVMNLNFSSPVLISPGGSLVSAWRRILQLSMISRARTKRRARTSPACLDGHIEVELGVGGVGRGAAQVLAEAGGASRGSDDAAGDGLLFGEHADACAARAGGGTGGEDGNDGVHHLALKLLDHGEDGVRIVDVAIDAADAVHGVVDAVAGDGGEHVHDFLADFKAGHEHGFEAHELGGDAGPENVRVQALELGHDDANVLGARRRFWPVRLPWPGRE